MVAVGGIRTRDLRVMGPTSYLTAPPRVIGLVAFPRPRASGLPLAPCSPHLRSRLAGFHPTKSSRRSSLADRTPFSGEKRWTLLSTSEVWRFSRRGGLSLRLARTVSKDGNRYRILSDSPRHLASKPPKHLVRDKRFIPFRCFGIPDIDFSMSPSKSGIGCGGRI